MTTGQPPESSSEGSTTSSSLLRKLQQPMPDDPAWRRMNHLYAPLVLFWCKKAGLNSADAEDVIQEVFRTLFTKVGEFERKGPGSFRGWLKVITRNKIGDVYRRLQRPGQGEGGTEAQLRLREQPELIDSADAESEETGLLFHRAIDLAKEHFEPRTVAAFVQVVVDARSPADVAAELEMTLNAVYVAKAKVLSFFRQDLRDLLD